MKSLHDAIPNPAKNHAIMESNSISYRDIPTHKISNLKQFPNENKKIRAQNAKPLNTRAF